MVKLKKAKKKPGMAGIKNVCMRMKGLSRGAQQLTGDEGS